MKFNSKAMISADLDNQLLRKAKPIHQRFFSTDKSTSSQSLRCLREKLISRESVQTNSKTCLTWKSISMSRLFPSETWLITRFTLTKLREGTWRTHKIKPLTKKARIHVKLYLINILISQINVLKTIKWMLTRSKLWMLIISLINSFLIWLQSLNNSSNQRIQLHNHLFFFSLLDLLLNHSSSVHTLFSYIILMNSL